LHAIALGPGRRLAQAAHLIHRPKGIGLPGDGAMYWYKSGWDYGRHPPDFLQALQKYHRLLSRDVGKHRTVRLDLPSFLLKVEVWAFTSL
jgi:hypothetical protein